MPSHSISALVIPPPPLDPALGAEQVRLLYRFSVVGYLATLLVVLIIGAIVWDLVTWYWGLPTSSSHALIGGFAGAAVVKAGVGALVGAIVAPGARWERLSDSRVRVSVAPGGRGAAVALSLRF